MSTIPADVKPARLWTIGHSVRPIEEFLDLLAEPGIETVVDVRSFPGSRRYPQYGQEALKESLASRAILYQWLPALGGRRKARADSKNLRWRNASFRGYADHMATPEFTQGLGELSALSAKARAAVMCSEAVWWRCHRSLISDALCAAGIEVIHILGEKHLELHPMTEPARFVNGTLSYSLEESRQMSLPE